MIVMPGARRCEPHGLWYTATCPDCADVERGVTEVPTTAEGDARAFAYVEFPDGSWHYLTTITGAARVRITTEDRRRDVLVSASGKVSQAPPG